MTEHLLNYELFTVVVLCIANIHNYMDRFILAGILNELKEDFDIGDDLSGLIQSSFTISYLIFAPIFGYLGDRFSRKPLIILSVTLWTIATFCGSFATCYKWFYFWRALLAIGEAAFSSIAPTVIYDVSPNNFRKYLLALFYIGIPIGSRLGFIVGARGVDIGHHWWWALRVTPVVGLIEVLLLCFIKDPVSGEREKIALGISLTVRETHYFSDLCNLIKNRSYMLVTLGFTSMTFVNGAFSWWGPVFMYSGFNLISGEHMEIDDVAIIFGMLSILSVILGVPLGAYVAHMLIEKITAIDPIICGFGQIISCPFLVNAIDQTNKSILATFVNVFVGQIFTNVTWAVVTDILLSVVLPEARATAVAFQILISHALGDSNSPYLIGLLSEELKKLWYRSGLAFRSSTFKDIMKQLKASLLQEFEPLQTALYYVLLVQVLGGLLFILSSCFIAADLEAVNRAIAQ